MDERKAFEAWLDFDEDQMQMLAGRDESGDYLHATIAIQWEAWAAATAAERERNQDAKRYCWLAENAIIETDVFRHDGKDPASTKHPLDMAIDAAIRKG